MPTQADRAAVLGRDLDREAELPPVDDLLEPGARGAPIMPGVESTSVGSVPPTSVSNRPSTSNSSVASIPACRERLIGGAP